jgi:hypothetical protein
MKLGLILLVAITLVACAKNFDAQDPSATKGTPDVPCGNIDQVCDVMPRWQDDTCCPPNTACPGSHGGDAPPESCEDSADFDPSPQYGMRTDAGVPRDGGQRVRHLHPLRKAVQ